MRQHHPRDINEAVDQFHEFLVRCLYYLTGNWHVAEDLAQDVWERIWRGKYVYDVSRGSYRTWLCWLARQRAFVHNRSVRRRPPAMPADTAAGVIDKQGASPLHEIERNETGERVKQAIMSLPDFCRQVVSLYYIEGMACEEIACVVDCPVHTVHSRLHAARKKLRGLLAEATTNASVFAW